LPFVCSVKEDGWERERHHLEAASCAIVSG
jgi:hypothetical protein